MKFIFCLLTILCCFVLNSHAVDINNNQRDEYLRNIVEDVWNQLMEYDFSNLPVQDYDLAYNTTTWGYEFIGHAYYEDGFVMDIESAEISSQDTSTFISMNEITLNSAIVLNNIDVFYDVRADFTVAQKIATVIIKPPTYTYVIRCTQDLATMNVVGTIVTGSSGSDNFVWDYNPDDPFFERLRKHYVTHALGTSIVGSAISNWRPIIQEMLAHAVGRYKFPDLVL